MNHPARHFRPQSTAARLALVNRINAIESTTMTQEALRTARTSTPSEGTASAQRILRSVPLAAPMTADSLNLHRVNTAAMASADARSVFVPGRVHTETPSEVNARLARLARQAAAHDDDGNGERMGATVGVLIFLGCALLIGCVILIAKFGQWVGLPF